MAAGCTDSSRAGAERKAARDAGAGFFTGHWRCLFFYLPGSPACAGIHVFTLAQMGRAEQGATRPAVAYIACFDGFGGLLILPAGRKTPIAQAE